MSRVSNMTQTKGSATKTPVSCPNIIKLYNNGMGGVDIMDQKTHSYRLNCKSKHYFYLTMFFDLIDVILLNSYIVYTKLGNDISLMNLKIVAAKASENLMNCPCPKKLQPTCPFQEKQMRYARMKGQITMLDHSTYAWLKRETGF